jgi:hypothetical protein
MLVFVSFGCDLMLFDAFFRPGGTGIGDRSTMAGGDPALDPRAEERTTRHPEAVLIRDGLWRVDPGRAGIMRQT